MTIKSLIQLFSIALLVFALPSIGIGQIAKELNDHAYEVVFDHVDSASSLASRALSIAETNDNKEELARAYKITGITHWFRNEFDQAIISYGRSLKVYSALDNQPEMANLYSNSGLALLNMNRIDTALSLFQEGLKINFKQNDSVGISIVYGNIGVLYSKTGSAKNELKYSKLALQYSTDNQDVWYSNIGELMSEIHGADSALFYLRKGLPFATSDHMRATLWNNMATQFVLLEDYDSATICLGLGIPLLRNTTSESYGQALRDQGTILRNKGQFNQSLEKSMESLSLAQDNGFSSLKITLLRDISKTYELMNKHVDALKWEKAHYDFADSMKNNESQKHFTELQERFEFEKNKSRIGALRADNLSQEVALGKERNLRNIIILSGTAIILLIGIGWVLFKRREESKRHELEMRKVEIEQRLLRSQMNPHFIFNALNSIQSYVTTNKTFEAELFLSKFSSLIRKILENSTHKAISVEEEVETLRLYLELEKDRFNDKFDFEIDDDADETLTIPPMFLQPFVENAIIHGMKGKREKGLIKISFQEVQNSLICTVEDDGVGRLPNQPGNDDHQSLATSLTSERIKFLNAEKEASEHHIEIVDLTNKNGKPCGTRIIITIPIDE